MSIKLGGNSPKKITMRKPGNNFATQGPCPDGFHVPSKDERVALCSILTDTFGLADNATTMGTYLKMPIAGYRDGLSSSLEGQGLAGYYWTTTAEVYRGAYNLYFSPNGILDDGVMYRVDGCSVRPFKNTPVALSTADIDYFDPDTQWPVIPGYETLYWNNDRIAGIYRDDTNGIITLSSDGETWITIADKNLGATTVYNDGDTLSQANCGNYYQWGNNYGFPWTGEVTISGIQVNASGYGPGNYYSGSIFRTVSESPYDWSSVQNDNLWGGVTGNVPTLEEKEIKRVTIRPNGTEKQIRPVGWTPGANTLLYLPLESDVVDQSGKTGRTFTTSGISYTTVGGVPSIHVGGTGGAALSTPSSLSDEASDRSKITFSCCFYVTTAQSSSRRCLIEFAIQNKEYFSVVLKENTTNIQYSDSNSWYGSGTTIVANKWNNVVVVKDTSLSSNNTKIYINGNLNWQGNAGTTGGAWGSWANSYDNKQGILTSRNTSSSVWGQGLNGNAREFIIEDKARTAQEVANYSTWIKSKLGF